MNINSDINILGGLPDWNLIQVFLSEDSSTIKEKGGIHAFTAIKTDKSVKRFEKAIKATFLSFKNPKLESIFHSVIKENAISAEVLMLLFWNASANNELLNYINTKVFFPAFYSGRVSLKKEEIEASLIELKQTEIILKKWTSQTLKTTSRKYLTLLKKFGLMEGSVNKRFIHPHLSDTMFVLFAYWLSGITNRPNLLNSDWVQYSFSENQTFIDRLLKKKFSKYFNVFYTGDKLNIEPIIPYESIYEFAKS